MRRRAAACAAAACVALLAGLLPIVVAQSEVEAAEPQASPYTYARPYAPCGDGYHCPGHARVEADDYEGCPPGYGFFKSRSKDYYAKGNCFLCESGFYSAGGKSKCIKCGEGDGYRTPKGAHSPDQCWCIPGFGGAGCKICPAGTFSPGGDHEDPERECHPCPENSVGSATPGATSKLECGGCNPGFGGRFCEECAPGTWSKGGNYSACIRCGPNQDSPRGSSGPEYCQCTAGYGLPDPASDTCELCPLGTFWPGPAGMDKGGKAHVAELVSRRKRAAAKLKAGKSKVKIVTTCDSCDEVNEDGGFTTLARGADSVKDCVCQAGFGGPLCDKCPKGTWSAGGTRAPCTRCGGLGTTASVGATGPDACGCQEGFGGVNCERCPANSFSEGGVPAFCQPCPANTQSVPGATSEFDCKPKPGFGVDDNGNVTVCPPNTWSAGNTEFCTKCPENSVSPSGSTSSSACLCKAGFKPSGTACIECGSGEVCPGGTSPVGVCPPGAVSANGTDSAAGCVCQPGYGGANCDLCPESYFSPGKSLAACQKCPLGFTSSAGSTSQDDCVCLPGRGGPECELCDPGFWSAGGELDACTACPNGSTTYDVGAVQQSDCVCKPGFTGVTCQPCGPGEICPGGNHLIICPANSYAPENATTIQQCLCKPGTGKPANNPATCNTCPICEPCPAGTWSPGATRDTCQSCPAGSSSPVSSTDKANCTLCPQGSFSDNGVCHQCPAGTSTPAATAVPPAAPEDCSVCAVGFGVEEGGHKCVPCPAGTYSAGGTLSTCSLCPIGTSSRPGANSSSECFCNVPGYGAVPGSASKACQLCPVGTYSSQERGINSCQSCGVGFTTLQPGSASNTSCVCAAGYGWNGTTCTACIAPYYQGKLDANGVPATTATAEKPYPLCLLCTGAAQNGNGSEITGDINKICTFNTTRPSAYCLPPVVDSLDTCGVFSRTFTFTPSASVQSFTLPNNIVSVSAELWGAAGGQGLQCSTLLAGCVRRTLGGLGAKLSVTGLQSVVSSGQVLSIVVGEAGQVGTPNAPPPPALPTEAAGGGGGGYSAILAAPDVTLPSTRWLASAGGGGGGSGFASVGSIGNNGGDACLGGTLATVSADGTTPPKSFGLGGLGTTISLANGDFIATQPNPQLPLVPRGTGEDGAATGGGNGGASNILNGNGGGGGSWGLEGAAGACNTGAGVCGGAGGYGGGGAGATRSLGLSGTATSGSPGGGGGGGYIAGKGGDNVQLGPIGNVVTTNAGQGGNGGNCIVTAGTSGSVVAGFNSGDGLVKITVVASLPI